MPAVRLETRLSEGGNRRMRLRERWMVRSAVALVSAGLIVVPAQMMQSVLNAAEPIVIGEVGPLSPPGGYADGQLMKDAAILATDEINAKGGVLGRQIKVSYQDTRGLPEEGTASAERLTAQEHVVGVFGEFHSSVFLAEMEVMHRTGTPIIAVDVWANKITAKGYPEVFRVAPCQALIATEYGEWLAASGFKNIAVLYEKTDGGQSARDVLLPILDKHKIKYDVIGADLDQKEFTAQIERLKSHKPAYDFFATMFSEAGLYALVSQAHSLGFAPTAHTGMYNSGGPATTPTFWQNVKDAGKYLITEVPGLPKSGWNSKTKAFVAAFKKRFNSPPTPQAMESYDAEYILVDAIRRAKSTDGKAIIAALEKTNWVGTRGKTTFATDKNPDWHYHQFVTAPVHLIQYTREGQTPEDATVIWPTTVSTGKFMKPGK
jgi:branched-chain amino acid transport system substrate-binding protein